MIDFLPPIYPDELLYSWIARWYVRSGYSAYSDVIGLFYGKRTIRPDIEFINRFKADAFAAVSAVTSIIVPMHRYCIDITVPLLWHFRFNKKASRKTARLHSMRPIPFFPFSFTLVLLFYGDGDSAF